MYGRTSAYKLSRNEEFLFVNIAQTNKLWLPIHLLNTEPCAYEHVNKLTLINWMIYLMKKLNLQTHFKEHIIFISRGSPLVCWKSTEVSEERCLHLQGRRISQARKQHDALLATFFTLIFCLAYSSALKMEATHSSEISIDFQQCTQHYVPEDRILQIFNCLEHSLNCYDWQLYK
jgi:hypothetical protein